MVPVMVLGHFAMAMLVVAPRSIDETSELDGMAPLRGNRATLRGISRAFIDSVPMGRTRGRKDDSSVPSERGAISVSTGITVPRIASTASTTSAPV